MFEYVIHIYRNVFIIKFWVVYVCGDCIVHVLKLSMLIETFTCMQRGLRLLRFCCFFSLKCFYNGARCRRYYDCHGNNNGNPITPLSWLQPSCCPFSSSLMRQGQRQIISIIVKDKDKSCFTIIQYWMRLRLLAGLQKFAKYRFWDQVSSGIEGQVSSLQYKRCLL